MSSKTRLALDFAPLLVFFLAYHFAGLLAATASIIVMTLLTLAITYYFERRIAAMPLISGLAITILGAMTLWLHDDRFIKIKPTLVNLLFAAALLGGLYFRKPVLKYLLSDAIQLTETGWQKLSLRWGLFFIFLAALNEVIWRNFPTDFWVNFKVFGMFVLTMGFAISQMPLLKKYGTEPNS